jgi:hypothetical protein
MKCVEVSFFARGSHLFPNPHPYFAQLPDPRRETLNKLHALSDILSMALVAIVSGADDLGDRGRFLLRQRGVIMAIPAAQEWHTLT